VEAFGPSGEKIDVSQRGALAVIPQIAQVGFYQVSWQGPQGGSVVIPANLTSVAESDLTQRPLVADGDKVVVQSAAGAARRAQRVDLAARARCASSSSSSMSGISPATRAPAPRWPAPRWPARACRIGRPRDPQASCSASCPSWPSAAASWPFRSSCCASRIADAGVGKRRVLLAGMIAGALPALYVGLTWTALFSDSYLRLARPWVTLLLAAATSFIACASRSRGRSRQRARGPRRPAHDARRDHRGIAAAGAEMGKPLDRLTVLIAVDRSRSIDLVPNADKRIPQELSVAELGMREDDRIGTIAFAAEAATEDPPRPKSELGAPQRVAIGRDGTDLAAAIRRALAEVPSDSAARIVLLSDGVATRGDTMAGAAAAVAADLPIDVVPLEQRTVPDVRVVALRAPTRADEGEAMDLRLVTASPRPRTSRSACAATAS
jgi:hypothetical protein